MEPSAIPGQNLDLKSMRTIVGRVAPRNVRSGGVDAEHRVAVDQRRKLALRRVDRDGMNGLAPGATARTHAALARVQAEHLDQPLRLAVP